MFYGLTYCLVRSILGKVRKGMKTTAKGGLVQRVLIFKFLFLTSLN